MDDISFYGAVPDTVLDVPVANGEIVSINLVDELPEDPQELISFLEGENCARKYWVAVARAYLHLGKPSELEAIIKHAVLLDQFNSADKLALRQFGMWIDFYYVLIGVDKAERLSHVSSEMSKLAAEDSGNSAILAQAVYQLFKGRDDKAGDIFDKLVRIDPHNCFALLGKAQILVKKTKNYSAALKLYQQVLLLNPLMRPDPRIGIGMCFWFLKDREMAVDAWNRSVELHGLKEARLLLLFAKLHETFTESLSDSDFVDGYRKCMEDVAQLRKTQKDPTLEIVVASYFFARKDYDKVESILGDVCEKITGDRTIGKINASNAHDSGLLSQVSTWSGRISFAKGDYTAAARSFQAAIKLDDSNQVAKLGLGQAQVLRGSVEEASMTFELIVRAHPKCLEAQYLLGFLYSQSKSRRKQEHAIQVLERYIKLSNNEPVALNAYLLLSRLYENKDISQSLNYLLRAIDLRKKIGKDAPMQVYNNIGVFQFTKGSYDDAVKYFEDAEERVETSNGHVENGSSEHKLLDTPYKVTLSFNLARAKELSDKDASIRLYEELVLEVPQYFSAKLRLLFLDCLTGEKLETVKEEITSLLEKQASNLEARSFYGWFVKNFGKRVGLKPDVDTTHQKETLVKYDSHDSYALVLLANIYCAMARETAKKEDDKRTKYYIRAAELFAKVLSVDLHNVYAAQGLAIAYIENHDATKGLDILRKIRDSLNDILVYLNLAHVLCELKQYGKAIENYEIALSRFTDGKDIKILGFLGRAWSLRGSEEQVLEHYVKALEFACKADELSSTALTRFNIAFLQYQMAEFVSKQPVEKRSEAEIERSIEGLREGISILNALSSEEEKFPPYPKAELQARAVLGELTLLVRLQTCLEETKLYLAELTSKMDEAMKLREQEQAERRKLEEERLAAQKEKEEEIAKQRAVLQEQAQQWAEEARMNVIEDDSGDEKKDKKRKSVSDSESDEENEKPKKKKKVTRKKKVVKSEDEQSESEQNGDDQNEDKNEENGLKSDEDDDVKPTKKGAKSQEIIKDSDEELEGEEY